MPLRPILVLALLAVAACGSDADHEDGAGGAGGDGAAGGSGGGGTAASGGSGGSDGTCTVDGAECEGQESCVFTDGTCGDEDPNRHCEYVPPTCGESPLQTVCGCDGKTRAVNCVIGDVDTRPGACPAPAGQFWCGALACDQGQQYCNLEFEESCQTLPDACQGPGASCDCLEPLGGTCMCTQMEDGHLEVTCYTI